MRPCVPPLRRSLLALACMCAGRSPAAAETRVVSPDGTGDYPTIQAAVDAAITGDVVLLTDGIFTGDGNRDVDPNGKAITIASLSGEPMLCVIDCQGSQATPHRGFIFDSDETNDTVVDGLTVRNGYATDAGGAMVITEASPVVRRCRFEQNASEGLGGAIAAGLVAAFVMEDCVIESNVAGSFGGGLYLTPGGAQVARCLIRGNTADTGGGVFVSGSMAVLDECSITGNRARSAGGVELLGAFASVIRCTVAGNEADEGVGGIAVTGIASQMFLERSIVWGNCGVGAPDVGISLESEARITCSDVGEIGGEGDAIYVADNVSRDPLFCDPTPCGAAPTTGGDYTLDLVSICLPDRSPCDARIGAFGEGCEGATPREVVSWGALKRRW